MKTSALRRWPGDAPEAAEPGAAPIVVIVRYAWARRPSVPCYDVYVVLNGGVDEMLVLNTDFAHARHVALAWSNTHRGAEGERPEIRLTSASEFVT